MLTYLSFGSIFVRFEICASEYVAVSAIPHQTYHINLESRFYRQVLEFYGDYFVASTFNGLVMLPVRYDQASTDAWNLRSDRDMCRGTLSSCFFWSRELYTLQWRLRIRIKRWTFLFCLKIYMNSDTTGSVPSMRMCAEPVWVVTSRLFVGFSTWRTIVVRGSPRISNITSIVEYQTIFKNIAELLYFITLINQLYLRTKFGRLGGWRPSLLATKQEEHWFTLSIYTTFLVGDCVYRMDLLSLSQLWIDPLRKSTKSFYCGRLCSMRCLEYTIKLSKAWNMD